MGSNSWNLQNSGIENNACLVLKSYVHDTPDVLVYDLKKQKTKLFFALNGRKHRLLLRTHLSLLLSLTKNWDCGFS